MVINKFEQIEYPETPDSKNKINNIGIPLAEILTNLKYNLDDIIKIESYTKNEKQKFINSVLKSKIDALESEKLETLTKITNDANRNEFLEKCQSTLVNIYKKHISAFKLHKIFKKYTKKTNTPLLEKKYLDALENININRNVLIIIDDCGYMLKKITKDNIFKYYFFNGRHSGITIIITAQAHTNLEPDIRNNAMISVFTATTTANVFFDSDPSVKPIKKELSEKCATIQTDKDHKFYKAVFQKETSEIKKYKATLRSEYKSCQKCL